MIFVNETVHWERIGLINVQYCDHITFSCERCVRVIAVRDHQNNLLTPHDCNEDEDNKGNTSSTHCDVLFPLVEK